MLSGSGRSEIPTALGKTTNMKLHRTILPAAIAALAVQVASAQEVTVKWFEHINGVQNVDPANALPILKKQGAASISLNGTDTVDAYSQLIRYNADKLLLGVRENGINETDANLSAADKALAAAYPDRSLIWLDAKTGKPLGIAFKESLSPTTDIGIDVTAADQGDQSAGFYAWWRVGIDEGPEGQRALYSAFRNYILRYAPKAGGGWESTPTVAYREQVKGIGDGLSNGDGYRSWRFRDFHVRGSGVNTVIMAGGGTWRAGHHPQVLKTTDGKTFFPAGRVDNRDNGARRNDYALGGLSSFPVEVADNYGGKTTSRISVVYASHFPGTGWPARPNRYTLNLDNPYPSPDYNQQPNVGLYIRNETAFGGLPAFNWEAAGKDGLPINHEVDGVTRYDGNWNFALQADPTLDYIVAYSGPSWNSQFGDINKPAWLAVHRLDGSIASGSSSVKLDFNEDDEIIESNGAAGHDFLYDPWIQVIPDQSAASNLDKSEVLVSFGSAGFGVFEIQNVAAKLISSPANQTVAAGGEVTFAANVTGSPNAFQWFHNGKPVENEANVLGAQKASLTIKNVSSENAGKYKLVWTNPISGAGETAEATLTVTGDVVEYTVAQIAPEGPLAVEVPAGSVVANGPDAFTVKGPGLVAWPAASNVDQPGDVQEMVYKTLSGDFDLSVKIESIESGPQTDPVDAWASGGLQARVSLNALSPSFMVNVGNPKGVNEVRAIGRAIEGQNYTTFGRAYPGVDKTLPNQWVRLRRVGNWFAAYVGTDGKNWSLIGQRWQEWPGTLLVGAYAFSASYNSQDQTGGKNLASVKFSQFDETEQTDTTPPAILSAGTIDKKTVGVRFSEPVNSASSLLAVNYKLSQGSVTSVRPGVGGDSVYLTVTGLTSDTFSVTVLGGIVDTAGNRIRAGSTVSAKASAWKSTDIGLIQSGDPNVRTAGDDPYRKGQAVATSSGDTETEIEIIGGGSNAWNPGDYVHYLSGPKLNGDFDVTVEVSRNDRPANTAAWANSGLMMRESEYVAGQEYTQDGTKVAMVANTTYIEGSAPNRAGIPLWREEPGAGYGNGNPGFAWTTPVGGIKGYYLDERAIDAAGTPDPESSALSSRWLRMSRAGNDFTFYVSYDGKTWATLDGPKTLPLEKNLIFGFSTMNDSGSGAPPNNGYGGNGYVGTDLEGQQNPSNYSVQIIRIGTKVAPRDPIAPLKSALIKPTEALPVALPDGSVSYKGDTVTVAGPGLVAWAAASNADQPGDVQQFAYEEITGDFDVTVKVSSITSGPVTDPVDAWASGGLQARVALNALSPSFLVNVGNPKGVNEVRAIGRATAGQNYTSFGRAYPGVDKNLPGQFIRLRRVGNWFAGYVGTDGTNWSLIGQRWQEWPDKLLVGLYAFSATYNAQDQTGGKNLATVEFSGYSDFASGDTAGPVLESVGTIDNKTIGVKFSEPVASATAFVAGNYKLSQGTVTAVSGGIGGDSVYLSVSGLTSDSFDVTVNNVTDTAGNVIAANSKASGKKSAWKSTDIGLIQSGNPAVRTAGDDPYRIGQAVAVSSGETETEIEIIGGGSNAWNPGDYIHYVSGPTLTGDFEVTVEVSRNDRPANTAAWANSGLMLRESEYVAGSEYTADGTKVAMVANTTYIEGSAPNRAGIPLWREEPGAGYGNGNPGFAWTTPIGGIKGYYLGERAIDAAGTPDPESSPLSSRWLRIKRAGNDFTFSVSYDGVEWALLDGPKTLPLSEKLIFGFSTMSDTGSGAPPNNGYGGNGFLGTDLEGQQNPSNYSTQRIRIGTKVSPRGGGGKPTISIQGTKVTFTGKLQEATTLNGAFTDVPGATSPYQIPMGSQIKFYRSSN